MKTKTFTRAIELASRVVERRNTIPVLGMMRLQALAAGRSRLSGTDMDMQVDVEFEGEVGWEGMLPMAGSVAKGLRCIGNDLTELFQQGNAGDRLKISSGDFNIELDAQTPPSDFPTQLDGIQVEHTAEVGAEFIKGLRQVKGAISTEATRYYLNGVYIHTVKAETWSYRLVTTDGHRMYMKDIQIPGLGEIPKTIIPRKTVALLLGLIGKGAALTMEFGRGVRRNSDGAVLDVDKAGVPYVRFIIKTDDHTITVTSKTIDGSFPDYSRVVPNHETYFEAVFNTAELRRKLIALGAGKDGEKSHAMKFTFLKDNTAKMECSWGHGIGKASLSIPYEGDAHRDKGAIVGFNREYVYGVLETMNGAEETMFQLSPLAMHVDPLKVKGKGMDDFSAVLMPMRV